MKKAKLVKPVVDSMPTVQPDNMLIKDDTWADFPNCPFCKGVITDVNNFLNNDFAGLEDFLHKLKNIIPHYLESELENLSPLESAEITTLMKNNIVSFYQKCQKANKEIPELFKSGLNELVESIFFYNQLSGFKERGLYPYFDFNKKLIKRFIFQYLIGFSNQRIEYIDNLIVAIRATDDNRWTESDIQDLRNWKKEIAENHIPKELSDLEKYNPELYQKITRKKPKQIKKNGKENTYKFTPGKNFRVNVIKHIFDALKFNTKKYIFIKCTEREFFDVWTEGNYINWLGSKPLLYLLMDLMLKNGIVECEGPERKKFFDITIESGLQLRNNDNKEYILMAKVKEASKNKNLKNYFINKIFSTLKDKKFYRDNPGDYTVDNP